ncbi:MAG: hypothetical protein ACOYXM_00955 [Actinomycetota bacterium]
MRARWVAAGVAVAALAAASLVMASDEPETSFCTADGLLGPNGETYGRRHPDCRFVDDYGNLITTFADGRPLCYAVPARADDDQYGRGPVDCDDPGPGMEARRSGE